MSDELEVLLLTEAHDALVRNEATSALDYITGDGRENAEPMAIVYYVSCPRWMRLLRSACERITRWSGRFDTYAA